MKRNIQFAFVCLAMGMLMLAPCGAEVWEEWVSIYDGPAHNEDQAAAMGIDSQGNVYVTGKSWGGASGFDYATVKYDSTGAQQWETRYNGPGDFVDVPYDLAVDESGYVYITGESRGETSWNDYATIKYNPSGVPEWVARYNGSSNSEDKAMAIAVSTDGDAFVTGYSWVGSLDWDICTIKYNSAGVQQWVSYHAGAGNGEDLGIDIAVDANENVYITGFVTGIGNGQNYVTIKYDPAGNESWVAVYDGAGENDEPCGLALDAAGNVYVSGSIALGSPWHWDYVTIKYNSLGVQQWLAQYNGPGNSMDEATALVVDANQNVYVTGHNYDWITIKYDSAGNLQWLKEYSGPYGGSSNGDDFASAVAVDAEENVYVAGASLITTNNYDAAVLKYSPNGAEQWIAFYGDNPAYQGLVAMYLDDAGSVYGAGDASEDFFAIKYSQSEPDPVNVTLTPLDPPLEIPPAGGPFLFNVIIANNTTSSQTLDAWIMVYLPSGSWYGPVLGPINVTLPGNSSLMRFRWQEIPGYAPAGTYTYRGYIGTYPAAWDSSSFAFVKMGSGNGISAAGSWNNSGEDFGETNFETCKMESTLPKSALQATATPNPFNPITTLTITLPAPARVTLEVFDINGRLVTDVGAQHAAPLPTATWYPAGTHQITFDGSDLPSGVYLYRITAGQEAASGKMVLLK